MNKENDLLQKIKGEKFMEKKRMKKVVLSLGLVSALGVGATLAYFTDISNVLTNTFKLFGDGSSYAIDLRVDEHAVDEDSDNSSYLLNKDTKWVSEIDKKNGVVYENLQPSMNIYKDPTVYVAADSVDCYVVLRVTNTDETSNPYLKIDNLNRENWTDITNDVKDAEANEKYYVYNTMIENSKTETPLEAIFTSITVDPNTPEGVKLKDIVVDAAAAQADVPGENNNDKYNLSINEALKKFNKSYKPYNASQAD